MLGSDTEAEHETENCTEVTRHEFRLVLPDPKKLAIMGVVILEIVAIAFDVAPSGEARLMAIIALVGIGAYCAYLHEIDKRQKYVDERVEEARESGRREAAYSEWIARMEAAERDQRSELHDAVDSTAQGGDDDDAV